MEERDRLRVMIEHWIKHNEVHFDEYQRWAEKASSLGMEEVKGKILQAVEQIKKANDIFRSALEGL